MKKTLQVLFSRISIAIFLLSYFVAWGQTTVFTESMGTVSANTTIAAHEAANGFDNDMYTMTSGGAANPGDLRSTNQSSGYSGASGGANVWLTTTDGEYGFGIEGIDASSYTGLTLYYAYYKNSPAVHANFKVDYWNGTSWVNLANTSANLFNESATASAGWYLAKPLSASSSAD